MILVVLCVCCDPCGESSDCGLKKKSLYTSGKPFTTVPDHLL